MPCCETVEWKHGQSFRTCAGRKGLPILNPDLSRKQCIDFSLPQYEWQQSVDAILRNINLEKIEFLDGCSMSFSFLNSIDGERCSRIICENVWKFTFENDLVKEEKFPLFICEIRVIKLGNSEIIGAFEFVKYELNIPDSDEYFLLCMDSGDYNKPYLWKSNFRETLINCLRGILRRAHGAQEPEIC